jgi:all-trans-retinol 13,14-reductase
MEIDNIIIGSGAGGLSAGLCLARSGQSVLVLEQHDVPGGWCHSFYLNGHRFSPGVHYIGQLGPEQSTAKLYEGLGIANDLVFFQMNTKAFEHCWIGDEKVDLPAGFDEMIKSLSERFPHEKKNLEKYLKTVKNVSDQIQLIPKMSGFIDNITIPFRTKHLGKYGLFSLKRVIDWYIKDPLLKAVLNIQCGDHGLPPNKASFPVHCAVMEHYFNGGYYPMGGGSAMVKSMTNAIKKHGGQIRTRSSVKRILIEGEKEKRAVGVELENGEIIYSKRVISNTDPNKTYLDLVGKSHLSSKLLKKINKTKYSCTSLMLFLTVEMDVREAGMDSGNIWLMPNKNIDETYDEMLKDDIISNDEFPGLFISCSTLKDPTSFNGKHHNIEVISFINYDSFKDFKNEDKQRSKEYLKFKEELSNKIMNSLERVLPGVSDKVIQKDLGTPITNEYYINSTDGSVYGTEKTFMQSGPFSHKPESEIENLYLCGASIMAHGIAGASHSGVKTAAKVLNCTEDDLLKPDSTQNLRVYNAEDSSEYPDWMIKKIDLKKSRAASKA